MKGRKSKPSHLHVVNGNPGKRPRNRREPKLALGIPSPPDHLSDRAKVAWVSLSVKLNEMGVLSYADVWALEQLAENYAEILDWRQIITCEGKMIDQVMSDGITMRRVDHPACTRLSDAEKRFKAMMTEFGL